MVISDIDWPKSANEAVKLYINFDLLVLDKLGVRLGPIAGDAINLAKQYVADTLDESVRVQELERLWSYLYEGRLQEFKNTETLSARVAISLLSPTAENAPELGQHLSWFLELMGFIGADTSKLPPLMRSYFAYKTS